ncbi:WD40-repeat-containing domain protein [Zopfochytrium polystomum]|nr:WD40-repeat-containing domain protein [Zopfochytrium polystomum]
MIADGQDPPAVAQTRPPPSDLSRPHGQQQHEPAHPRPLSLEAMPEEILHRVLLCVASDVKSLASLSRASKFWSRRAAADGTLWRAMFLARWNAPVSLADSPNILDRGQPTTTRNETTPVLWKKLFRDRRDLARFRLGASTGKLKGPDFKIVRGICVDAFSIVTADDNGAQIWDRATRKCVRTLAGSWRGVRSVACHGSTIVCGTLEGEVKAWNAKTGKLEDTLRGLSGVVHFVYVNAELVVGADEDRVNVWSRSTKAIVKTFTKAKRSYGSVDAHNGLIAFTISDNTVQVLRLPSGDLVHTQEFESAVSSIQLENSTLAAGCQNGVYAWDIRSGKRLFGEACDDQLVVLSLHCGNLLVKSKIGATISIVVRDLFNGGTIVRQIPSLRKQGEFFSGLCLHASGVVVGEAAGEVVMWDFDGGVPYAHEFMELKK